jgi:hypothetical protein
MLYGIVTYHVGFLKPSILSPDTIIVNTQTSIYLDSQMEVEE